mmetsp:Transcript_24935/g.64980  ORF Transcript_24935/g.64980 Transcript_24935/m.64980 type:complete len:206 (-) Transcript_24935:526-1143(-)
MSQSKNRKSNPGSNVLETGAVTETRGSKLTFHAIAVATASATSNAVLERSAAAAMSARTSARRVSICFAAAARSGCAAAPVIARRMTKGSEVRLNWIVVGALGFGVPGCEKVAVTMPSSPQSRSSRGTPLAMYEMLAAAPQKAPGWTTTANPPAVAPDEALVDTTTTLSPTAPPGAALEVADSTVKLSPDPGTATETDENVPSYA